ncbi:Toll-like receptor 13 [Merluccius polli]|uniref:Toll-like receptor 13 n=1 Tax=Merluccius polli TaxID=89951 RepID=A0AA47P696_MERPO|nr:Toll-like receptor 13 [Merluccius polli]
MAISTCQLSMLTVGLLVHLSYQYGFKNCIGDLYSNNQTFSCSKREEKILSNIVGDLPASAINISITLNPVRHIPTGSFQGFLKLENLQMSNNKLRLIDRLAFQKLHHLKTLNLSSNNISELNYSVFQDLYNLTFLSLENNTIRDLPENLFNTTPHLNTLILRRNHLDKFSDVARSIASLSHLTKLDLCFNHLTSLSHLNILLPKSLTTLYVCGNKLSTLACASSFLMHITRLDLSYNSKLSATAFKGVNLTQIRYLLMSFTKVKILEFFDVSNVNASYVDLSGMGLTNSSLIKLCTLLRDRVGHLNNMSLKSNDIMELQALSSCPQITGTLDVSKNKLKYVKCLDFLKGQKHIQTFNAEHCNITHFRSCKNANKLPLTELTFRYNRIREVKMNAFAHTINVTILNLNINIISLLSTKALRGLTQLQTLRLDNNLLSDLEKGMFVDLSSLKILNLRNNRISVIFNGIFLSLGQLTTLDLGGNKISHFDAGGLDGLKSLTNLYLDRNNLKLIDSSQFTAFQTILRVLDFQGNQIQFISQKASSPFVNLSSLIDLKLDGQQPYGIIGLPHGFFRGLHSLRSLFLTNNRIDHMASDVFDDLKGLHYLTLDNSENGMSHIHPGLFKNLRNLTVLSLENMGIHKLTKGVFANLSQLRRLQLGHNVMQHLEVDILDSLPSLQYLDLRYIPLSCSCQNEQLQKWTLSNPNVQLRHLHSMTCPASRRHHFYNFDTNVCYIHLGKCLFFTTAAVIFVFSVVPLLYVKLYWKMKYGYYAFRAWFSEQWRKLREDEENCDYDAFISYNFNDEHWVLEQLLPNMEGNGSSFKLCLHHRDFEPGRCIVDNIVSAVYSSRKTVCVVSRNFLQSEWCSLEIQLASYRLFAEHRDVLLLVLLERIPERELSSYHRMRKVMLRKTYLQWPDSECTDPAQAQLLFWNQLRRALRTDSRLEDKEESGFKNCIGNSNNQSFKCPKRDEESISFIVGDLPASAINISVTFNSVRHIPTGSFQGFLKLENLQMSNNKLRFIDRLAFQKLHHLKTLNLSSNHISELNYSVFQDLYNLTFLSLENNTIRDLPENLFNTTPHLNTLILRRNRLDKFSDVARSIASLSHLTKLDLCFNHLTSLSHLNILLPKSLTTLYVCGNKLSTLACASSFLMHITRLDLSYNSKLSATAFKGVNLTQIRYLLMSFTKVKILEFFDVSNVNASYVDLSGMGLPNSSLIKLCTLLRDRVGHLNNMSLKSNDIMELQALSSCPQITGTLDVSKNKLKYVKCLDFLKGQKHIQTFSAEHCNITHFGSCKNANKLPLTELTFRYNRIREVKMNAFAHTINVTILNLNINIISLLSTKALRGLTQLQTLRLDNNLLSDLERGMFVDLSSLKILNLRNNRISVIFKGIFLSLGQLTTLDLGGNKISHFDAGGLDGLKSLTNLYLDRNNLKLIDSSQFTAFQTILRVLDFRGNQIRFISQKASSPFVNLSSLIDLKLDGQQPDGIIGLPRGFFRGLHSLRSLYLTNNRIAHIASNVFDDLKGLNLIRLDNSGNGVVNLQPGLFKRLRNLTVLSLENMGIHNLPKGVFANLSQLRRLQLGHNVMQHLEVDILDSLPSLQYLDLRYIPLSCSCQNEQLQKWTLSNPNVQSRAKKHRFYNFDTNVCYIHLGKCLFFTTAAVIFVFSVVPLLYVKLYWKMKYGYYAFRAWFSEQWRKLREDEENCDYDAFISYNFNDEHWVLEQLLPNMEGNGSSFKLCLHHRDFEPGRCIVDNIVSAVYSSRKTVCVVSRNFLQSEWCSLEIQLASYRLFAEHRDVLLLVLLERIPERELSSYHRMRKVMLRKTYLQWPDSECTDPAQAQLLFWNQLRRALRTDSRLEDKEESGFKNCIGDLYSNNQTFSCFKREEKSLSNIVGDLPASAINISITLNPVRHIPTGSFQGFLKLENLQMSNNKLRLIDRLAFQKLHHLKTLNLSSNNISELNYSVFQDLYNLTFLSLENNMIRDLPENLFNTTPHLNTLILRRNRLDKFSDVARSIASLSHLTKLDLCFNHLTSLSHLNILLPKSLTTLYVCGNKLSTLACASSFLMHITRLDLSYNSKLSATAFKGVNLTQIRYLLMSFTKVKILEFFDVSNVNASYVDLSGMGLTNSSLIKLCTLLRDRVGHLNNMSLKSNDIMELQALSSCPQITGTLDVSKNKLKDVKCLDFLKGQKHIQTFSAEHCIITHFGSCKNANKLPLTELTFRYNRIREVEVDAFAHTINVTILNLNINIISFLSTKALRGLTQLQTLRLDNNLLSDLLMGMFEDLSSLKILNLRNNRISVIFKGIFLSLGKLTTLDLGGNKISHFDAGGLDGLKSLTNLYLDRNNLKLIDSSQFTAFQTILRVLDFQGNQIQFLSQTASSPFVNLSSLIDLKLDGQQPYGIIGLPRGFFRGLHSLRSLYLTNNRIDRMASDVFDDLKGLHSLTLDNSGNGLSHIHPGLFKNLRNLIVLSLENMGIHNLPKGVFANLSQLRRLQLGHNVMQHLEVDILDSLPSLQYLDLRYIPLSCSCQNGQLQNWTLSNPNVQSIYLHSLTCPASKKHRFYNFDTNVCYIHLGKCLFFTTAAVIFVFSVVPLLYVKLYWKMKYGYYAFRAWFSEQWRKLREDEENCDYDAFISYNFNDEHWVLEQLLPNMEGNGSSFKLCLHHRDFEPGRCIVDNIVSAVYSSRKTVCVVSRNFLQSEWCSLEIQLASYRLFAEHRDVLLLVLLERIPERELSSYHRMRKVMLRKTYLQWPDSECTDPAQAQLLFWNQLRRALRTDSRMEDKEESG